jgi:hypothetical protein
MSWMPDLEKESEETHKSQRQLDELSNISLIKTIREIGERYDELKLGLKIAHIVANPLALLTSN